VYQQMLDAIKRIMDDNCVFHQDSAWHIINAIQSNCCSAKHSTSRAET